MPFGKGFRGKRGERQPRIDQGIFGQRGVKIKKAVFLDRDGTINEDAGHLYTGDRLVFIPGAVEALKLLQESFTLFIVTNQSGIGEGVFSAREYRAFDRHYRSLLREKGVRVEKAYCCPHTKQANCSCRKPGTYFLEQAVEEYGLDINNSYVIGDHPHDVETGFRAGANTIYLLSGHGRKHLDELAITPDKICADLPEAALWILRRATEA